MNNYTPISCSFYDELEALATRKERVIIEYYDSIDDKISAPPVIKRVEGFIKISLQNLKKNLLNWIMHLLSGSIKL